MNIKKFEYIEPEIEIIRFAQEDVITTSNQDNDIVDDEETV